MVRDPDMIDKIGVHLETPDIGPGTLLALYQLSKSYE
jgi:hypothetical protein